MSESFDPRLTPARPDLAAEHLRGIVRAERYKQGTLREIIANRVGLTRSGEGSPLETELLLGERFTVYEEKGHLAWGQAELDGYVGYISRFALGEVGPGPTHRVAVPASRGYEAPSGKALSPWPLSLGSRLRVVEQAERFSEIQFGLHTAFVPTAHIRSIDERVADFVAVAEQFVGVPYVWGGRTSVGLDCSALVQLSLAEAGIRVPRDSDQQCASLGIQVGKSEALGATRRGDLVFWKGHVAIALDERRIIHANAFAMAVSIDEAIPFARQVEASEGPVIAINRL